MLTLARLLRHLSWPELIHHPWQTATAALSVMLGVALAFSVHLINESALGEFSAAVRQVNAQPDFELRGQRSGFDESLYGRVAAHPSVASASPLIEIDTYALGVAGERQSIRVIGIDALLAASLSPQWMPLPTADAPRLAMLDPNAVFLNPAARQRLAGSNAGQDGLTALSLQSGVHWVERRVQGNVAADGPPLAVMDIAGVQAGFGWVGRLSRIDVRLVPGADRAVLLRELELPPGVRAAEVDESAQRVSQVSRAYRVNLTVLALVALFTGAFLVFSILALSVAQRLPQLALLGVIGLSARLRMGWVLAESAVLGLVGSLAGLALGTGMAWLALELLSGDLGGAYFPGVKPKLQFSALAAMGYGGLGIVAALAGGWMPARVAARIAPAQALKGLGADDREPASRWQRWLWRGVGPALLVLGAALAFALPIASLPIAAYGSVALLLLGGIACVPAGVGLLLAGIRPARNLLALLAIERARHQRDAATIAVAGVVASLSLAVALTVMVASFRGSIIDWLDTVLPADLYARTASSSAAADSAFMDPLLIERAARLPGVDRLEAVRSSLVTMDPERPAVALISRPLGDAARDLPLVGSLLAAGLRPPTANVTVYVSEAMVNLYGASPGRVIALPLPNGQTVPAWVRGVWRDYARQHGAVVIGSADFVRLTGDQRVNDLAMWLVPGTDPSTVQAGIRQLAGGVEPGSGSASTGSAATAAAASTSAPIDFATPGEIRALSMRIFDRSFAVTYWLQALAIGIGLFGIAASFSAQVLARRKEFGLLSHLGLTRREILVVVASEGAVWTAAGALLGLVLGLAVSVVLVHVVNPQSFNWTMQLLIPAGRLAALCAAVMLAGTLTAWWAGRAAARRDLALAVKEDW